MQQKKKGGRKDGVAATRSAARKDGIRIWPLYLLFLVFMILYIATQGSLLSTIFGAVAFFLILIILAMEFIYGGRESGYVKNIVEVLIAIGIVAVFWIILIVVLHTQNPINVVPSCSMLPVLHRGDMVVLYGTPINRLRAPVVDVSRAQAQQIFSSASSPAVCLAYRHSGSSVQISQMVQPGFSVGLFTYSGGRYSLARQQNGSAISYSCGTIPVHFNNGTTGYEAYTASVRIANTNISENLNNSVIIYKTMPQDSFYSAGDAYIIHRAYAILNQSGTYYVLTKGDNNPGLDIQYGNLPSPQSYVEGQTVLTLPYFGYLKLVISGQLAQPAGCNSTVVH